MKVKLLKKVLAVSLFSVFASGASQAVAGEVVANEKSVPASIDSSAGASAKNSNPSWVWE